MPQETMLQIGMGEEVDEVLPDQPVLVAGCIDGMYVGVAVYEVGRVYGSRQGVAVIGGRTRRLSQRYPGMQPDFEWFIHDEDREGIEPLMSCMAKE